jgi:glycosyltransferase involved in cell wall biosynthesis
VPLAFRLPGGGTQSAQLLYDSHASLVLTVVVPAYNEEKRLPTMLDETLEYLRTRAAQESNFTWEVIVVADGCTDETAAVALRYVAQVGHERVRLLELTSNVGKGGAVRLVPPCFLDNLQRMADGPGRA